MSLASLIDINVPVHGLVYSKDHSMTYFIKRFDRVGHHKKIPLEDFSQLSGASRDTKYRSSMEKVVEIISKFCSYPKIELQKLLKLTLFNFLIGNEDMHLKNFSLITQDQKVMLAPAYDLLNTTIALGKAKEEVALSIRGKKNNLTKNDLLKYFAGEKLGLNQMVIDEILQEMHAALPRWRDLMAKSFLSQSMQKKYLALLEERCSRLDF